jgi:hypothetical protein
MHASLCNVSLKFHVIIICNSSKTEKKISENAAYYACMYLSAFINTLAYTHRANLLDFLLASLYMVLCNVIKCIQYIFIFLG